jgi:ATP-binding cassette subfamily B protein/subfamily B ATP-binding cassette protein MsbA
MPEPTKKTGMIGLSRWALKYALRRWTKLLAVLSSMLLNVGLDVLKPWPMVFLVDYVLRADQMPWWLTHFVASLPGKPGRVGLVGWSVAATVLIFLLSWAVGLANSYASISLGQRMVYDLASDLFAKMQQLSLRFHSSKSVGDSIRRVTSDCGCVSVIVKDALLPVIGSVVSVVLIFGILWRLDPLLSLLALAVVPYMLLILGLYARPMLDRSYEQQEEESRIYEIIEQTFSSIPAIQAFCREDFNDQRFRQATSATVDATLTLTRVQLRFKVWMGVATAVGTAGIYWLGAEHGLTGDISIGTILLFLSYLGSLYDPLATVMYTSATIQGAAGSAHRVREILQSERTVFDKPGAVAKLPLLQGRVQFENVTFGYDPGRPVLRNISLTVEAGETVALVGATGAGKSTLVAMIPRFIDPWEGRVTIDGRDLRDIQLKILRENIGIVLQEPFLFPLSVGENIAYARRQATMSEIEVAARIANAHDFIMRLPEGYHTVIGERGATLSGGERQRLSIARALLKTAPILILDEPTSALDAETELSFFKALKTLARGHTTFIIAHRLSTVRRANRIVVLKDNGIAEIGSHEELLARRGLYAHLYEMQFFTSPIEKIDDFDRLRMQTISR